MHVLAAVDALREQDADDVIVIAGGVIPQQDYAFLELKKENPKEKRDEKFKEMELTNTRRKRPAAEGKKKKARDQAQGAGHATGDAE